MREKKVMIRDSKEHRSALGRLLAREDITVNHGNYKTAFFDVKNRVLGLPDWNDKSKSVYDLLLGHEVGHALYTPLEALESVKGLPHFDVINIVEDVRIERMIQKTYPGLPRYFKEGYTELWDSGFFGVEEDKFKDLNFLDRLNLHAKIGSVVDIPLNDEEKDLYNECYATETFDDVMKIYQKIVDRLEEEEKEKEEMKAPSEAPNDSKDSDNGEEGEDQAGNSAREYGDDDFVDDGTEAESGDKDSDDDNKDYNITDEDFETALEELEKDITTSNGNEADEISDFISSTQRNFDDKLEDEAEEKVNRSNTRPIIFPKRKTAMKHVTSYSDLKKARLENLKENGDKSFQDVRDAILNKWDYDLGEYKDIEVNASYKNFTKESAKKVGVLVREFEQKKAAYQYSRATVSRSGVIDVNKMHSYKYDDNIFSSISHLADAKSHGMIFLIDNSGSMSGSLGHVIKQTLMLTEFCDKVGIPYEVYTFTDNRYGMEDETPFIDEVKVEGIEIVNVLSSSLKKKEKQEARIYLYGRAIFDIDRERCWFETKHEGWGGTPLNTCLMITSYLIDDFRAKHPVQKLNVLTLSDGDSHEISTGSYHGGRSSYKVKHEGKKYNIANSGYWGMAQTKDINKMIADSKDVTMIGFFIPESKHSAREKVRRTFDNHWDNNLDVLMRKYRKENHLELKDVYGYKAYYVLPSNPSPILQKEFDVNITDKTGKSMADSRSSQTKLAKEFAKHNTDSKNSRILMEKFATLIG
tara:strand:- start:1187 stop:3445 length:2259 start_codon:yes stop_codon:yes gene_type:complete